MKDVEHQPEHSRFLVDMENEPAVLLYRISDNRINFYRTYVPDQHRGKGVAEAMVRKALAWARSSGYEIEASCWYVQKFLK